MPHPSRPPTEELLDEAYPIRKLIERLLKDKKVSYTVAIIACTQVMLDLGVHGLGLSEQEARRMMADLFKTDIMNQ